MAERSEVNPDPGMTGHGAGGPDGRSARYGRRSHVMNAFERRRREAKLHTLAWIAVPLVGLAAALLIAPLTHWIDERTHWTLLGFEPEGARTVVGALGASLMTFIVFACSTLLLVVQMASVQLSPRVIARVFEDRLTLLTLGAFIFSWAYALAAAGRISERVPQLQIALSIGLSLGSIGLFLLLVQRLSQGLRPVILLSAVAADTSRAIDDIYPMQFHSAPEPAAPALREPAAGCVPYVGPSGAILAMDLDSLAAFARDADCTFEVIPSVGDRLCTGEPLLRVWGSLQDDAAAYVSACVLVSAERRLGGDPMFGFRIIVDIAAKALSPSINDPTTAVMAIDQLYPLLLRIAGRELDPGMAKDTDATVRVVYRTPTWDDFVTLACTEIRHCGATSPQVTRRLKAMLESAMALVPSPRAAALQAQLRMLQRAVERSHADPDEREMASRSDAQGFGVPKV